MNHKQKYLNSYKKTIKLSQHSFDFNLTESLPKNAGRNNRGRITVRRKGGGHKKRHRLLDLNYENSSGSIVSFEYDPNRTAFIAGCVNTCTGKNFYTLLPDNINVSNNIREKQENDLVFKVGYFTELANFPLGSILYALEGKSGGVKIARSAGTFVKLIQKDFKKEIARVRLPSKKEIDISLKSKATFGTVSNGFHNLKTLSKAGRSRWLGKRPSVRGVAMNPVDHPHGGGEGRSSGGRPSVTPWGRLTKGKPTVIKK